MRQTRTRDWLLISPSRGARWNRLVRAFENPQSVSSALRRCFRVGQHWHRRPRNRPHSAFCVADGCERDPTPYSLKAFIRRAKRPLPTLGLRLTGGSRHASAHHFFLRIHDAIAAGSIPVFGQEECGQLAVTSWAHTVSSLERGSTTVACSGLSCCPIGSSDGGSRPIGCRRCARLWQVGFYKKGLRESRGFHLSFARRQQ